MHFLRIIQVATLVSIEQYNATIYGSQHPLSSLISYYRYSKSQIMNTHCTQQSLRDGIYGKSDKITLTFQIGSVADSEQ